MRPTCDAIIEWKERGIYEERKIRDWGFKLRVEFHDRDKLNQRITYVLMLRFRYILLSPTLYFIKGALMIKLYI